MLSTQFFTRPTFFRDGSETDYEWTEIRDYQHQTLPTSMRQQIPMILFLSDLPQAVELTNPEVLHG
ncbi:hypothetical protein [Celerinatantimonas sp. YJH-8]|uniref:hypothetical protein n=1 Tax=Celerinatantimonas sp. YJH-8 TaxID=3228714 RepID=UPI0038C6B042